MIQWDKSVVPEVRNYNSAYGKPVHFRNLKMLRTTNPLMFADAYRPEELILTSSLGGVQEITILKLLTRMSGVGDVCVVVAKFRGYISKIELSESEENPEVTLTITASP